MSHPFNAPPGYTGCANELEPDDDRLPLFQKQVSEQGWDDTDTWCLRSAIAVTLGPRLRRFKELTNNHPTDLSEEQWARELDQMILAFHLIETDATRHTLTDKEKDQIELGLDLFRNRFHDLWW